MSISRVKRLDPLVAERIAAGEVIERPGSVVKELVENSLDAKATEIAVILEDGGKGLIEVLDNGQGIHKDDLSLTLERHATSKIQKLEDLEAIATLGFRGEALPSIAAVSNFEILSRNIESKDAYEVKVLENGSKLTTTPVTFGEFLGSQSGTRIRASNLFSQIPVRLKFLKAASSEVSNVREWLERIAISHPETGFQLIHNDRSILRLKPDQESIRAKAILASDDDYPVISESQKHPLLDGFEVTVRIHWLQGLTLPHTRKMIQVINGRAVKDRVIQQAILQGFKQVLLPGSFPALALFIEIDPSFIDVNVHPSKTEIRFLEQNRIFRAIEKTIHSMVEGFGAPVYVPTRLASPSYSQPEPHANLHSFESSQSYTPPSFHFDTPLKLEAQKTTSPFAFKKEHPLQASRYLGTLFNTYLLFDLGNEAALVDQHAAHERIRFEKLKARALLDKKNSQLSVQQLLLPEPIRFAKEKLNILTDRLEIFDRMGFEVEFFSNDTLLFRAVPAEWGTDGLKHRLSSLVERVANSEQFRSSLKMDEALFEEIASEACHSSIRAGDALFQMEAIKLVDDLFDCEHPWNCPHGRPTIVRVPEKKFEEWFLRKV